MPCRCGCGLTVRPGSEFRRGHVRRYIGILRKRARDGDLSAISELSRNGWSMSDTRDGRKFGVELEFFGMTHSEAVGLLVEEAGIDARDDGYHHEVRPYWRVTEDGSVSGSGLELVSPILRLPTDVSKKQIMDGTKVLRDNGARIDRSCGHHVHHDASKKNIMSIYQTVLHYCLFQHHIDSMLPASRRSSAYPDYCRPHDLDFVASWPNRWAMRGERGNEPHRLAGDKYFNVGLGHLRDYGTIEFRQHSGTLNGTKVWNWSRLTRLFMDISKDGMKLIKPYGGLEPFRREFTFDMMLDYLGADDDLKEWARSRVASLDGTTPIPDSEDGESETRYEGEPEDEPYDDYEDEPYEGPRTYDPSMPGCRVAQEENDLPLPGRQCFHCGEVCVPPGDFPRRCPHCERSRVIPECCAQCMVGYHFTGPEDDVTPTQTSHVHSWQTVQTYGDRSYTDRCSTCRDERAMPPPPEGG